jgi:hypothetical protein
MGDVQLLGDLNQGLVAVLPPLPEIGPPHVHMMHHTPYLRGGFITHIKA